MRKILYTFFLATTIILTCILSACGDDEPPAHVHTLGKAVTENTVDPTCYTAGSYDEVVYCTECNEEVRRTKKAIANLTHEAGDAVRENEVAATCYLPGRYDECTYCKHCNTRMSSTSVTVDILNHSFGEDGKCTNCTRMTSSAGLEFTLNPDGESYTMSGIGTCTESTVVIDLYNGLPVTEIDNRAFKKASKAERIIIGDSVVSFGRAFFENAFIKEVYIGNGVLYIEMSAFQDCYMLETVTMGTELIEIGASAFQDCYALKTVFLGDNLLNIDSSAFRNCSAIKSIIIPESVEEIGPSAFQNCSAITELVIPDTVFSIGSAAFRGCSSITEINIPSILTEIEAWTFDGCSSLKSVTIPRDVFEIGEHAFTSCTSLESIIVEDGNEYYHSFGNCLIETDKGLLLYGCKTSEIPADGSVTEIGTYAFAGCTFTEINLPDSITVISANAFDGCKNLVSIVIPDGVDRIAYGAFNACSSLKTVILPKNLVSIGNYAFSECTSMESINFPSKLETIGNYAFFSCKVLHNLILPDSVSTIGNFTFAECDGIVDVDFGNGVTKIGDSSFSFCTSLSAIEIPSSLSSIGNRAFEGCHFVKIITVESGNSTYHAKGNCLINTSAKTLVFGCSESIIPNDGSVTAIGEYAFSHCSTLTAISLPLDITVIKDSAFLNCVSITEIIIPSSITSIEKSAFRYCKSLKAIVIPDSISKIDDMTFDGCESLESITLPDTITYIGSSSLSNCPNLKSLTIPARVNIIGPFAFYNDTALKSIIFEVPYGWTCAYSAIQADGTYIEPGKLSPQRAASSISGEYYDYYLRRLDTVIDDFIFVSDINSHYLIYYLGAAEERVELPESFNGASYTVYNNAFKGHTEIAEIVIPSSVRAIGTSVFEGCTLLSGIYISDLKAWCDMTFASVTDNPLYYARRLFLNGNLVTELEIPRGVTSLTSITFPNLIDLESVIIPYTVTTVSADYTDIFAGAPLKTIYIEAASKPVTWTKGDWKSSETCELIYGHNNVNAHTDYDFLIVDGKLILTKYKGSATEVTIPTVIGEYEVESFGIAYASNQKITSIVIPDKFTVIGTRAFYNCKGLKTVTIGSGVTTIEGLAFGNCQKLESISLGANVKSIGSQAFYQCFLLNNVIIPDSVETIGTQAFRRCYALETIKIGAGVTRIDKMAFYECKALVSATFSSSDGWFVTNNASYNHGQSVTLTDAAQSATLLNTTYYNYFFKKTVSTQ